MAEEKIAELSDPMKDISLLQLITDGRNSRGIPTAKFIENLEEFLLGTSVEASLGALNDLYSKYKFMETSYEKSKSVYKSKIPEIEQTLELIRMLKKKKEEEEEFITNYCLSDTVYAKAKVDTDSEVVYLWVGANTMVQYSYDEAIALLEEQHTQSQAKLQELTEDLYHLRGSSITVEVNMARLFNHSVKLKKMKEAALAAVESGEVGAGVEEGEKTEA